MRSWLSLSALVGLSLVAACKDHSNVALAATTNDRPTPGVVVDSAMPMDALLERFRHDIPTVATLHSDITSRDELVTRIVGAMAKSDTATIERLTVNVGEYAWLYFPTTKVAKPPYEIPPSLAWFQVQAKNRRGATRALRELGGHRVSLKSYRCDAEPTIEEQNRIWTGCAVTIVRDNAKPVELKLFGAILERAGRFAVISYQNDF